jgi:hypothetical protein
MSVEEQPLFPGSEMPQPDGMIAPGKSNSLAIRGNGNAAMQRLEGYQFLFTWDTQDFLLR